MVNRKPLKRANGQGSVYKLSGRRRRPWVAVVTEGKSMLKGDKVVQNRKIIGYFERKTDAEKTLLMYNTGLIVEKSNMTLGEVYEEWSTIKFKYISKGTSDGYKASWNRLKIHENENFTDLRTVHFQNIIDKTHNEGLSRSTLEKIKATVIMLYDYAIQNDVINKNYGEFLILPKVDKRERDVFHDLEIKKIEDNMSEIEWLDTILILIYTGMRLSEMIDLTKFNVDWENDLIIGGNKTDAGKDRIIPIHPKIKPIIKKWYNSNGETLIHENGKKLNPRDYREKKYRPALKKIGVRPLNPHTCRHTFASIASKAGVDPIYIQKIIGHADYSTTANIYTHPEIEELKSAMCKIGS